MPPSVGDTTAVMISAADRGLLSFAGWMGIVLMTAEGLRSWRDLELVVEWLVWLGAFMAAHRDRAVLDGPQHRWRSSPSRD